MSLDDTDIQIIQMKSGGKTDKYIAWKIGSTERRVRHRVTIMRKHYKCENTHQLIKHLYLTGQVEDGTL
jgi:DNA-binding NarL/FixJ family response regulator